MNAQPHSNDDGSLGKVIQDQVLALNERCPARRAHDPNENLRATRNETWSHFSRERGKRYAQCRLENYRCEHEGQTEALNRLRELDVRKAFEDGTNLILFGPKGTGKDHLLTAMIRRLIGEVGIEYERNGEKSSRAPKVKWTTGVSLFADRRDALGSDSEAKFLSPFVNAELLAVSDPLPPFGALTDFQVQTLYMILDSRYSHCRPTWCTLNVADRNELDERLSPQVADRLIDSALTIFCNWPSFRASGRA